MAGFAAGDPDARIAWRKENEATLEKKEEEEKKDNETVKTKGQARACLWQQHCPVAQAAPSKRLQSSVLNRYTGRVHGARG